MSALAAARRLSIALALVTGLVAATRQPVTAQTGVVVPEGAKTSVEDLETTLARLLDGWPEAARNAGEGADPSAVAEALVAMLHQPSKSSRLEHLQLESERALKGALKLAETQVRSVGAALSRGELDEAAARTAAQRAIDGYLAALYPLLEADAAPSAGVNRR